MDIFKIINKLQSHSDEAVMDAVRLLIEQGDRIVDLENKLATVNGGWIPVSLGFFPEDYISVLAYIPTDAPLPTVKEAYRVGDCWVTKGWFYDDSKVAYWMPMPEPPREAPNNSNSIYL